MKTLLSTIATLALTTAAYSDTVRATVTDRYTTVYESVPYTKNVCKWVSVPIYEDTVVQGDAAGGALAGMILGGILGKGVTGKDDGAAAGAVIGGLIGADKGSKPKTKRVIVDYKDERRCEPVTHYKEEERVVYDYSIIEWNDAGKTYSLTFDKFYREVGE